MVKKSQNLYCRKSFLSQSTGFARPGMRLMLGSMFVSYLEEFFSLRQKPQGLVGSSILALLHGDEKNERGQRLDSFFIEIE